MAKKIKGEYISKELKTKEVFSYLDEHNDVSVDLVKETFKEKALEIHYPYNRTTGGQAYKFISQIHYVGFSPHDTSFRGVKKAKNRGYGFTKDTSALIYYLEQNHPKVNQIWITKDGKSELKKARGILVLNKADFFALYQSIKPENDRHTKEKNVLAQDFLASAIPTTFKKSNYTYVKGELHSLIQKVKTHKGTLSDSDVASLASVIGDSSFDVGQDVLIDTKKGIDKVYIENVLAEFERLSLQTGDTETLEKKWQEFFKKHSWIFSFVFAYPVVFYEKEMYVGGTGRKGAGATYVDFVYKNNLSKNVVMLEIKTHASQLMSTNPYRKGAHIYSIYSGLSGAIVQVSDQRDKLMKNFRTLDVPEPFNPKCVVLIGSTSEFKGKKRKSESFELFRSLLTGVEIITFDELKNKVEILKKQLEGNRSKKTS